MLCRGLSVSGDSVAYPTVNEVMDDVAEIEEPTGGMEQLARSHLQ
jgi:hypothetical protein